MSFPTNLLTGQPFEPLEPLEPLELFSGANLKPLNLKPSSPGANLEP